MSRTLTRRGFLKAGAAGAAIAVMAGCQAPRRWVVLEPYVSPPEEQLTGEPTWYASTCRQCPAGCGVIVRVINGRAVKIEGNPQHPVNQGKLCARGQASLQLLYSPDRLHSPAQQVVRGSRVFTDVPVNDGINTLSEKIKAAGGKVAVWSGASTSGHLYDIFQRLNKAIGAPAPLVYDADVALRNYTALRSADRALFGNDALPIYDLATSDVVFSFGAEIFGPWLSDVRYGIEYGQFRTQALGLRGYMVQFEPRMSATGSRADRWFSVSPGTEGLVAQALVRLIADQGAGPADRVTRAKALATAVDIDSVAALTGITVDDLASLARTFATAKSPVAIPGSALAGQPQGLDATTMVQALNVVTGNLGKAGGLMLAPASPSPAVVPSMSTFSAAQQLIERMNAGDVQVLLVYGANPAYELPPQAGFVAALAKVPFVASFAPIVDETAVWADLIMPDRTPLESWGYMAPAPNFTTPAVGSLQPVVTPLYDLSSAGDIMLTVAHTIPAAAVALPYQDEVAMIKDTVIQLPPSGSGGTGPDVVWARWLQHGGWTPATPAAVVAVTPSAAKVPSVTRSTFQGDAQQYPYLLSPYMTILLGGGQGAALPWLQGTPDTMTSILWQTWAQISPVTAQKLGVDNNEVVTVTSPMGEIQLPVYVYPGMRDDVVAIPLGEGHTDLGRYARGFGVYVLPLLGATPDASGAYWQWSNVRVKMAKTGSKVTLATFEYSPGVREGFDNAGVPGE